MTNKIEQAQELLAALGMDSERSNERSAMTFLALAKLGLDDAWDGATNDMMTTREIMDWIRDQFGVEYAANTRETIRRFTLHQFIAGGLVEYNADNPNRATNSPKNNYRISPDLLDVVIAMESGDYDEKLSAFLSSVDTWVSQQQEKREMARVPVTMPDGEIKTLSAGGQNILIKDMVEQFCSRFVPGGVVLYIDDTSKKAGETVEGILSKLGIVIPEHGKAPDLIVYDQNHDWVFLMEACSTHGPIDVIRKRDLRAMFPTINDKSVYVSCFPDRAVMRKYLSELAWETEAWCADTPDHMIHLNGDRFLGPHI